MNKPTIYINQNNIVFNITGSLMVDSIQFSGLNQLAFSQEYEMSTIPSILCQIIEPLYTNSTLLLSRVLDGLKY